MEKLKGRSVYVLAVGRRSLSFGDLQNYNFQHALPLRVVVWQQPFAKLGQVIPVIRFLSARLTLDWVHMQRYRVFCCVFFAMHLLAIGKTCLTLKNRVAKNCTA